MKSHHALPWAPVGSPLHDASPSLERAVAHQRSVPSEADVSRALVRLEWLSRILDEAITIPGTTIRVGWDAVIGLAPVLGDGVTTAVSTYYLWEANRLGARKRTLLKMAGNVGVDFLVGLVPLVGDLMDVAWRANRRNLVVLIKELNEQGRLPHDSKLLERLGVIPRPHMGPSRPRIRSWQSRPFMLP